MARFRDTEVFGPTLDAAAARLGISPTAIEKDYWVSEILRALGDRFDDAFIFKGGTSLSKGYRMVERFSEDIDILVLPGDRGRGATDRLMKDMGHAAAAATGGTATAVGGRETGRHRCVAVSYPATRPPTGLIDTNVLLEMGIRGGPHPQDRVPIGCLLGDAIEAEGVDLATLNDLAPFMVAVLHPARTLLEKLVHVHALSQTIAAIPDAPVDRRSGRHFYDVYQLLGDGRVVGLLADRAQFDEIMTSIGEITRTYFNDSGELRPPAGFGTSPVFDRSSEVSTRLQALYEATMPELYFGEAPLPTWGAICERVAEQRDLL